MMWSLYEIIHLQPQYKYELFLINFTSFHCTGTYELNNKIDFAPNVWLHSSVGRASHRYRGGHGFESCWSPVFFRLLLSNCLNWKIYCDDHSSLSKSCLWDFFVRMLHLHQNILFLLLYLTWFLYFRSFACLYLGDGTLKHMNKFQEKRNNTGKYVPYEIKVIVNSL